MASTSSVGNLRAELTLNSQKFEKGIESSRKKLGTLDKGFGALKGSLAGILSAGLLVKLTKDALSFADAIGKSADRIGISTTKLQELRFAFDRAGVSAEQVDSALLKFGKNLGEGQAGFGTLTENLKRIDEGLARNVLSAGGVDQALDVVFDAMGKTSDQTKKLAIANAAFGKSGSLMTAAFKDMGVGFKESIRLARSLGIAMDEDLIRNAEATNDKMSALAQVIKIKLYSALIQLAPLIGDVADKLIVMVGAITELAGKWKPAIGTIDQIKERIKELKAELKGEGGISFSDIFGGKEILTDAERNAEIKKLEAILKLKNAVKADGAITLQKTPFDDSKLKGPLFKEHRDLGDTSKVGGFIALQDRLNEQLKQAQADQEIYNDIIDRSMSLSEQLAKSYDEQTNALMRMQEAGEITGEEFLALSEILGEEWKTKLEEAKNKTKETTLELQGFFVGIGQSLENALVQGLTETTDKLEALRNIAKSIIDDILRLIIRQQLILPLFGAKSASGATSFFGGLFGFAHGGQFTVGGDGGIDSNLVAFKASRGERVTVETPGQQARGDGGGQTSVTLNISTGVSQTVRSEIINLMPSITETVKGAVVQAQQRNQLGGAFG